MDNVFRLATHFLGILNQGAGPVDARAYWYNAQIGQQTNKIAGNQYHIYSVQSAEGKEQLQYSS
jgi:hypothetical protein